MSRFFLYLLVSLLPAIGVGQLSCDDEQIVSLELNMIAYNIFSHGTIILDCDDTGVQLKLTTFDSSYEIIESERYAPKAK